MNKVANKHMIECCHHFFTFMSLFMLALIIMAWAKTLTVIW